MTDLALARGNYLRPNGLGGYMISVSALQSWSRCPLARFYELRARNDPDAPQSKNLSATVYGSVVHHALQIMEIAMHEGDEDAMQKGVNAFEYYWDPTHLNEIGLDRVDEWLPRDTYGGLRERGRRTIKDHYTLLSKDPSMVLALEHQFAVPLEVAGRMHTLTGAVDRLAIRHHYKKPYFSLDDNKTGKVPTYLRYTIQGTGYAYASTCENFWTGAEQLGLPGTLEKFPEDVMERMEASFASWGYRVHDGQDALSAKGELLPLASRRFRWIDLKGMKFVDGGWRTPLDMERMKLGVDAMVRSSEAEIYSINTTGDVCRYCSFADSCAGVGLPPESSGAP